jgi:hypothetical protein
VRLNELLNAVKFAEASTLVLVSHSNMYRALLGQRLHQRLRVLKPELTRDAGALKMRNCAVVRLELDFTQDLANCIVAMAPLFVDDPTEAFEQRRDRKASVAGSAFAVGLSSMRMGRAPIATPPRSAETPPRLYAGADKLNAGVVKEPAEVQTYSFDVTTALEQASSGASELHGTAGKSCEGTESTAATPLVVTIATSPALDSQQECEASEKLGQQLDKAAGPTVTLRADPNLTRPEEAGAEPFIIPAVAVAVEVEK